MAENKRAEIPVASHGLHKHSYNYPWLSSLKFCEVMPCYVNTLRAGEKDNPRAGLASQLMPILHNAFATGRYNFKAIYVPFFRVWRPYTSFAEHTEYYGYNDSSFVPTLYTSYPYIVSGDLNAAFCNSSNGYTYVPTASEVSSGFYDISFEISGTTHYRVLTDKGKRILKVLMALGITPNWIYQDTAHLNVLVAMAYIKAFADYYFPNQYLQQTDYNILHQFFGHDNIVILSGQVPNFLKAIDICSLGYYDGSIFENCWDQPYGPNSNITNADSVVPRDPTLNSTVDNPFRVENNPGDEFYALNETTDGDVQGFSQWALNALKSAAMWLQRMRLSGVRLIDRFLVSRGIPLSRAENDMSYFMGQRNVEIHVQGVENNSDTNLGELAGRGYATSGDDPLNFKIKADADGVFFVIVHAVPDATFPVQVDGFTLRQSDSQIYHAEFDRLGPIALPTRNVITSMNGAFNDFNKNRIFAYVQNYWDEVQERPRLLGDFVARTRGAEELSAYHSFRLFNYGGSYGLSHGYQFVRQEDSAQYDRLFYSSSAGSTKDVSGDHMMLFLRWFGDQYKEKLPLGDSYEWDDDETNRRVNIIVNGSQK